MDHPVCGRKNCINYTDGYCALKNSERTNGTCLEYEDAMDFLRLKADALRGTLG